jgi:hypothetical protein
MSMGHPSRDDLFELGKAHIAAWCSLNEVSPPKVNPRNGRPDFGVCAYYRDGEIEIWVHSCATIGLVGRQWSYPGYVVDRTPYGVLAHELGHHVDRQHGAAGGVRSHLWRPLDAVPLTSYCPNDNEWFAELFRLFVTNPDLFCAVRPKLESLFFGDWPKAVEMRPWQGVLADSPRHIAAASNKILRAKP